MPNTVSFLLDKGDLMLGSSETVNAPMLRQEVPEGPPTELARTG